MSPESGDASPEAGTSSRLARHQRAPQGRKVVALPGSMTFADPVAGCSWQGSCGLGAGLLGYRKRQSGLVPDEPSVTAWCGPEEFTYGEPPPGKGSAQFNSGGPRPARIGWFNRLNCIPALLLEARDRFAELSLRVGG